MVSASVEFEKSCYRSSQKATDAVWTGVPLLACKQCCVSLSEHCLRASSGTPFSSLDEALVGQCGSFFDL